MQIITGDTIEKDDPGIVEQVSLAAPSEFEQARIFLIGELIKPNEAQIQAFLALIENIIRSAAVPINQDGIQRGSPIMALADDELPEPEIAGVVMEIA